jgi:hypothetical protein
MSALLFEVSSASTTRKPLLAMKRQPPATEFSGSQQESRSL